MFSAIRIHPSKPLLLFAGAPIIIQLKNFTLDYILLDPAPQTPLFNPSLLQTLLLSLVEIHVALSIWIWLPMGLVEVNVSSFSLLFARLI